MVQMMKVGEPVSLDWVVPSPIVGASAFVIFPCTMKPRRWHAKIQLFDITPWAPTCLCKQEVGKPSGNAPKLCAKADDGADNCGKAGDFGSEPGTLIH